jgi:hypothetical protein
MAFEPAAAQAARVLKPGGRLVVLGVWTDASTSRDLAMNVASTGLHLLLRLRRGPDAMTAPATPEQTSWSQAQDAAAAHLPTAVLKRHCSGGTRWSGTSPKGQLVGGAAPPRGAAYEVPSRGRS